MVAQASESLEEWMISDKKLPKPVDELDSHFKTRHPTKKGKVEKVYHKSTIKRNLLLRVKSKHGQAQILKRRFLSSLLFIATIFCFCYSEINIRCVIDTGAKEFKIMGQRGPS